MCTVAIRQRAVTSASSLLFCFSDPHRDIVQPKPSSVHLQSLSDLRPRLQVQVVHLLGTVARPGHGAGGLSVDVDGGKN